VTTGTRPTLAAALVAAAVSAFSALSPATADAATQVAARGRMAVDVWTNKEEGGVYRSGEKMQVFFRASQDAYVLLYNIDTEGYIHLIYPFRPGDPARVSGGETYRVPSRHDPYDLVAEGPEGVEYVVALASPLPFQELPWYLAPGLSDDRDRQAPGDAEDDNLEEGVIVGDPYVGMEKLHRRLVPRGREDQVASADTYFYIEKRVEYPRYVCADCHHRTYWFDPYVDVCNVIEIRIDATWARYAPLRVGSARPRYYYQVRSAAPGRYRAWKERWSSLDGHSNLRQRFVLEREVRDRRLRDTTPRRQSPPEFKDLRRYRAGRFWKGRDEVIPLRERQERAKENVRERREERARDEAERREIRRGDSSERRREEANERRRDEERRRDVVPPKEKPEPRERREERARDEERKREPAPNEKPEHKERLERQERQDRSERRVDPPARGRDREREERGNSGRGR
jgi:hypothetical protein